VRRVELWDYVKLWGYEGLVGSGGMRVCGLGGGMRVCELGGSCGGTRVCELGEYRGWWGYEGLGLGLDREGLWLTPLLEALLMKSQLTKRCGSVRQ
jgi:hypothetical protein